MSEIESANPAIEAQITELQSQCEHRERTSAQRLRIIAAQNRELKALRIQNQAMKKALLRISSIGNIAFEAVAPTLSNCPDITPFDDDV